MGVHDFTGNSPADRMKILLIADIPSPSLYESYNADLFQDVDMVVSCGDLPLYYLEFIVSTLNVPCFYVPGNHDTCFTTHPPPGWRPLDGQVINFNGITMMGLGGSGRYKPGPFQYSELEMRRRFLLLKPVIWWRKSTIDIFVSHAPAYKLGDLDALPHKGFKVFRSILDSYKPKYHLHGHVHLNYSAHPRIRQYKATQIINGYQYHLFDF